MAKIEGAIESLRTELSAAESAAQEQRQQVATLRDQLRQYQDKNNVSTVICYTITFLLGHDM